MFLPILTKGEFKMNPHNTEVRELIARKRMTREEVSQAWGVVPTSVSHILCDSELPPQRKKELMKAIRHYKVRR